MEVELHIRRAEPYTLVLDVPKTLESIGTTKVGLDALMEILGWFCATRDGTSDTYYDLGEEPYLHLDPSEPRTEDALARRLVAEYGGMGEA